MDLDFLSQHEKKPKSKKAALIDVPFEQEGVDEMIHKATDSGKSIKHGRYKQLTFRLPPDYLDEIARWAETLGVSQEDAKRWIVARGIQALNEGERPVSEVVTTRIIKMP